VLYLCLVMVVCCDDCLLFVIVTILSAICCYYCCGLAHPSLISNYLVTPIPVLGATGRIGRRIVRDLMSTGSRDLTVVAVVRDFEKARRVLREDYDGGKNEFGGSLMVRGERLSSDSPNLRMACVDLVTEGEVHHGGDGSNERKKRGRNNAKGDDNNNDDPGFNDNDILREALRGCTAVVSALGTNRKTNLFSEYFLRPWRIIRSPRLWCEDPSHPHYVSWESRLYISVFQKLTRIYFIVVSQFLIF